MNWTRQKKQIIKLLEDGKEPHEVALKLGVNEYDLRQFIHRNRLFDSHKNGKSLAYELIHILMRGNTDYFKPNREFFTAVKIRQKRWWALFRGEKVMKETEYNSLVKHLGITLHEAFQARQLNWITEQERKY